MAKLGLWSIVARELNDAGGGGGGVDNSTSAKLEPFIDNLTAAIKDLRQEISVIRENMRTDFSRLVDRQDSHFRWLVGLMVVSAIALGSLIYKAGHP